MQIRSHFCRLLIERDKCGKSHSANEKSPSSKPKRGSKTIITRKKYPVSLKDVAHFKNWKISRTNVPVTLFRTRLPTRPSKVTTIDPTKFPGNHKKLRLSSGEDGSGSPSSNLKRRARIIKSNVRASLARQDFADSTSTWSDRSDRAHGHEDPPLENSDKLSIRFQDTPEGNVATRATIRRAKKTHDKDSTRPISGAAECQNILGKDSSGVRCIQQHQSAGSNENHVEGSLDSRGKNAQSAAVGQTAASSYRASLNTATRRPRSLGRSNRRLQEMKFDLDDDTIQMNVLIDSTDANTTAVSDPKSLGKYNNNSQHVANLT